VEENEDVTVLSSDGRSGVESWSDEVEVKEVEEEEEEEEEVVLVGEKEKSSTRVGEVGEEERGDESVVSIEKAVEDGGSDGGGGEDEETRVEIGVVVDVEGVTDAFGRPRLNRISAPLCGFRRCAMNDVTLALCAGC
jgi:hypothetical protein